MVSKFNFLNDDFKPEEGDEILNGKFRALLVKDALEIIDILDPSVMKLPLFARFMDLSMHPILSMGGFNYMDIPAPWVIYDSVPHFVPDQPPKIFHNIIPNLKGHEDKRSPLKKLVHLVNISEGVIKIRGITGIIYNNHREYGDCMLFTCSHPQRLRINDLACWERF